MHTITIIFSLLALFHTSSGTIAKRIQKRCISIGGCFAYHGTSAACIVTGTKLFVNGLYYGELTSADLNEYEKYKEAMTNYTAEVEEYNRRWPRVEISELPRKPDTPSFCDENITTQYVFNGCTVQGFKVYVGQNYARDLTSEEKDQLRKYTEGLKKYEEYYQSLVQQRFSSFSCNGFRCIEYHASSGKKSKNPLKPVPYPKTPDFCGYVY
ncbi:hypothetical protein AB6A40_002561 [Gnathostoma spinigerum]|uniref:Pepsin inhibitor-3-like repeated domain-containing protein n=1 Tax=Gnathostoma spinigerum TaxID=75299 RepID=A0ABD6E961_9BILA